MIAMCYGLAAFLLTYLREILNTVPPDEVRNFQSLVAVSDEDIVDVATLADDDAISPQIMPQSISVSDGTPVDVVHLFRYRDGYSRQKPAGGIPLKTK